MFTYEITDDGAIAALNRLIAADEDPQPFLLEIGEEMELFTKQRFETNSCKAY